MSLKIIFNERKEGICIVNVFWDITNFLINK